MTLYVVAVRSVFGNDGHGRAWVFQALFISAAAAIEYASGMCGPTIDAVAFSFASGVVVQC